MSLGRGSVQANQVAFIADLDGVDEAVYLATLLITPPGDLDGDGDVDQADLGILLSCYLATDCGDLDGDGDTDQADLGILLANYGTTG